MFSTKYGMWVLTVSFAFVGLVMASSTASASPIGDVADGVNGALFGGSNLFAAQAILTAAVMMAAGLALAVLRLEFVATIIVLFAVLGALTAIGWAPPVLLLLCGLLVGGFFVHKAAKVFTGGSSNAYES